MLFDNAVSAQNDRDHFFRDWESNVDGHLMIATERFLPGKQKDFLGFKEYMRLVFQRPFVEGKHIKEWFANLADKLEGDEDMREEELRDLEKELDIREE